jgi:hypothetical protein
MVVGRVLVTNFERRCHHQFRLCVMIQTEPIAHPLEPGISGAIVDFPSARSSLATFPILTQSTAHVAADVAKVHQSVSLGMFYLGTNSILV